LESYSRKETKKASEYAEIILNRMCGWKADSSDSEQAKLGRTETHPSL
jgi:hypothetical protein